MSTSATIFTYVDDTVKGIYVNYDEGDYDLGATLEDNYLSIDSVINLIENGDASYIGESPEDSDFYADEGEMIDLLEASDEDEFLEKYGESTNYFFNPYTESWEIL